MASSGEVPDLDVLKTESEGDIELAMTLWTSRDGPVVYNEWQSTYFAMIRAGFTDAAIVLDETQSQRQTRLKLMHVRIQTDIHGPDYLREAVQTKLLRVRRVPGRFTAGDSEVKEFVGRAITDAEPGLGVAAEPLRRIGDIAPSVSAPAS
jgi:hypothetical protein